jgi:hypothetical protein
LCLNRRGGVVSMALGSRQMPIRRGGLYVCNLR